MKICVLGGINVDIEGTPHDELRYHDSNPGNVSINFGGVGRNIAENIARLGGDVEMISVAGNDFPGIAAVKHLKQLGVETRGIKLLGDKETAMYLSILNKDKDMEIALCDMGIIAAIDKAFIDDSLCYIDEADIVAVDCNFSEEMLRYICSKIKDKLVFMDPVSASKAVRAKNIIGEFDVIKPNIMEAEVLTGISIKSEEDLHKAGESFIDKGVKEIYITLNKDGVYFKTEDEEGVIRPDYIKSVSATGAGDSFSGAILYGKALGLKPSEIAKLGMVVSEITMESASPVNPILTYQEVKRREK